VLLCVVGSGQNVGGVADEGWNPGSDRYMFFTVALSTPAAVPVTVDYGLTHQTTNNGDLKLKTGALTLNPGRLFATFQVRMLADTVVEPNETFAVTLSNPVNALIAKASAIGTILNDDPSSGLAISITVTLSDPAPSAISVSYSTAPGTAAADSDYTSRSGTARIAAGKTDVTVVIPIRSDAAPEADESFTVNLTNPSGGAVLGRAQATGTILNDD
jgi:Calx-beta domain